MLSVAVWHPADGFVSQGTPILVPLGLLAAVARGTLVVSGVSRQELALANCSVC